MKHINPVPPGIDYRNIKQLITPLQLCGSPNVWTVNRHRSSEGDMPDHIKHMTARETLHDLEVGQPFTLSSASISLGFLYICRLVGTSNSPIDAGVVADYPRCFLVPQVVDNGGAGNHRVALLLQGLFLLFCL